jgi:c-di-GMP-binding flagellar brake protein YcgR
MRTALAASGLAMTSGREGVIEEFYRRRHIRYPLRVPVEFQIPSHGQQREAVRARSRDISEGGVFVLCKTLPALGANMELIIRLPAAQGATAPLVLEMAGEVIRLETPSGRENQWGFAVCARRTIFRSPS